MILDQRRRISSTTKADGTARTVSSQHDAAPNRKQLSASSGYLLGFGYDPAGRRSSLSLGGGVSTVSYGYDALGRLSSLTHDLAGTGADQTYGFAYNPASQVVTRSSSNDAYASNTAYAVTRNYTVNGLNQYVTAGPAAFQYDANADLTNDGSTAFVYDAENRLVSASGAKNATLSYDPLGRLWQVSSPANGTIRFFYDGERLTEEYDSSGSRVRAFAHGPGTDEPLIWWERDAGWQRRFLHADHQGSIVALNDDSGNVLNISPYDTWGIPNSANWGRFMYTGQIYLGDLGLYYYKARMYSPTLGRFMQTDPVGYKDQVNLYNYVRNDPVNKFDASGAWSADVHNKIFELALANGPLRSYVLVVEHTSLDQDVNRPFSHFNPAHFLRGPNDNPAVARQRTETFINNYIQRAARDYAAGNKEAAMRSFARAAHAYQDSFSPVHNKDGQPAVYKDLWGPDISDSMAQGHSTFNWQGGEGADDMSNQIRDTMVEGTKRLLERVVNCTSDNRLNHKC